MDAELTALATAGATVLVQQMATDGWAQVRERLVAFFAWSRGGDEDAVQGELETSRADLVAARDAADEEAAADVQAEWRNRLRRTLCADPEAAELRALLDELAPTADEQAQGNVHNTISGGVYHSTAIQARRVGDLTIGEPRG